MYPFKRFVYDWLAVHESRPAVGQRHMKTFVATTAPKDQSTFNIYASGVFEVAIGSAKQQMQAGMSTLDIAIDAIPAGVLIVEKPLVPDSVRFCCQPLNEATKWTRKGVTLQPGESLTTDGWIIPALPELQVVKSFTADAPTKVFVLERV